MAALREWISRLWGTLRPSRGDRELEQELQLHLELAAEDARNRADTPENARRAARIQLGGVAHAMEALRDQRGLPWLDDLMRDVRYGLRLLRRSPAFAGTAVLSLALGVGANTAIFQLIEALRLRTIPVHAPETLARVTLATRDRTGHVTTRYPDLTYPLFRQISDSQQVFSNLAAWTPVDFDLATGGESRPAQGLWVSGNFFQTLGIPPAYGRLIEPRDDRAGCPAAPAVVSYAFWQREFGGDRAAVGKVLRVDGHLFEIAGITPAGFFGIDVGHQFDIALPICAEPGIRGVDRSALGVADWWWLATVGRLKPGISIERATAELTALSPGIFEATVPSNYTSATAAGYRASTLRAESVETGFSRLRGRYNTPLTLLLALTGLVLLIACANLANLMLARASAREREMAIRLAIGASRRRLLRQLMSESVILAMAGAVAGAWIAHGLSRLMVSLLSTTGNPLMLDLAFNGRVLGFTGGLAVLTCVLFGLVPAIRATGTAPFGAMRASGRGLTDSGRFTLRRALVIGQLAVSLVLLVGALLFVRTLENLATVDLGFRTDGLLAAEFDLRRANVPAGSLGAFKRALCERVRSIPGAAGATPVSIVPVSGLGWNNGLVLDGARQESDVLINQVGGDFFELLGIPLIAGRTFNERDTPSSPKAAVVNQAFVRKYMGDRDPLGRVFHFEAGPGEPDPPMTVVGVVVDTKYHDIRKENAPIVFLAFWQDPAPARSSFGASLTTIVRLARPETPITRALAAAGRTLNPGVVVSVTSMKAEIEEQLVRERMMARLSALLGMLAAVLAGIGLYGVMSYTVEQRRQEIGIRMALGAGSGRVLTMILREAVVLVVIGVGAGAALAVLAGRSAQSLLFEVSPTDPLTIVAAVVGLATVGACASLIPAWRAARVEPTVALRET